MGNAAVGRESNAVAQSPPADRAPGAGEGSAPSSVQCAAALDLRRTARKGGVSAAKAVGTQREMRCLSHEGSGNAQHKGDVLLVLPEMVQGEAEGISRGGAGQRQAAGASAPYQRLQPPDDCVGEPGGL